MKQVIHVNYLHTNVIANIYRMTPDILHTPSVFQQNSSQPAEGSRGVCAGVPTHLYVNIRTVIRGSVQGVPQKIIQAVEIR